MLHSLNSTVTRGSMPHSTPHAAHTPFYIFIYLLGMKNNT